jgi:Tfp pilus assembly protein PilE
MKNVKMLDSGRSMIEMLGVLAIIGVLTVSAIQLYSSAMSKYNRMAVIEDISTMSQEISSYYAGKEDYTGISIRFLESAEIIPDSQTPWNTEYEIFATGEDNQQFAIRLNELDKGDCMYLADWEWTGKKNVLVGTTAVDDNTDLEFICTDDSSISIIY